jgi:hypothetical protein
MNHANFTRRALRAVAGGVVAATVLLPQLDSAGTASAGEKPKPPALTLSGTGTWVVRESIGDALVNGTGELQGRNSRGAKDVLVAAAVGADDHTLPGPGECEGAITTVSAYGVRGVDFTMIGVGEVCGVHPQPPTSIVTHVFTGTFEVYDVPGGPRRLLGVDGFFEVRLADNGTASVFAIDS